MPACLHSGRLRTILAFASMVRAYKKNSHADDSNEPSKNEGPPKKSARLAYGKSLPTAR